MRDGPFVDRWRGLKRFHHGGADAAHRSQLVYFPDLDAGVIVESNDAAFNAAGMADQVAASFLEKEMPPAPATAPGAPAAVAFDTARFDAYVGATS
jgi:hypothetical protein